MKPKKVLAIAALGIASLTGCSTTMHEGHPEEIPQWWRNMPAETKSLNVIIDGDPDDDPEYFRERCALYGADTELIFHPATPEFPATYVCEGVDF